MAKAVEGPDSGYSWVIMLCCAYIHFALYGLFRSSGVMFMAILKNYDVTREEASWPFVLAAAIFQLVGPVCGLLTYYMSQRKACILGSLIATFGIGCCYFAESVMWINIFFGVIHGVGFGILHVFIPVILNQYFVKHKATAIGIAFSGGTISSFIFPLVMEWLLAEYTLNDSFLLLSGVILKTLVASCLLRAPPWLNNHSSSSTLQVDSTEAKDSVAISKAKDIPAIYSLISNKDDIELQISPITTVHQAAFVVADESQELSITENSIDISNGTKNDSMLNYGPNVKNCENQCKNSYVYDALSKSDHDVMKPLMTDKQIKIVSKKEGTERPNRKSRVQSSVTEILKEPMFHFLTFSMCVYFLGVQSVFMVIVDFAKDKGIPEGKAIYLISMFSILDLLGRAGLGWITDRKIISRKTMVAINFAVLGMLYQLYPLIDSFSGLLAISAVNGLAVGCSITLFFVLLAECLGMKRLTLVNGLCNFINGSFSLLRPAIIGVFRDVIGSYNWMFHSIGFITLVFAILWISEARKSRKYSFHAQ